MKLGKSGLRNGQFCLETLRLEAFHASQAPPMERQLESELERLWQSKTDLHGIGYFMGARGGSQGSCAPVFTPKSC